jgi:hypothetical protein
VGNIPERKKSETAGLLNRFYPKEEYGHEEAGDRVPVYAPEMQYPPPVEMSSSAMQSSVSGDSVVRPPFNRLRSAFMTCTGTANDMSGRHATLPRPGCYDQDNAPFKREAYDYGYGVPAFLSGAPEPIPQPYPDSGHYQQLQSAQTANMLNNTAQNTGYRQMEAHHHDELQDGQMPKDAGYYAGLFGKPALEPPRPSAGAPPQGGNYALADLLYPNPGFMHMQPPPQPDGQQRVSGGMDQDTQRMFAQMNVSGS